MALQVQWLQSKAKYKVFPANELYPMIIPAIVADIREAMEPPISAFMPNSERFLR